jgi:hypothetical protein
MIWNVFKSVFPLDPSELARRIHSEWLTRAVSGQKVYPRIPVRPAAEGGFSDLLRTPEGRASADQWWETALEMVDDLGTETGGDPKLPIR